MTERRHLISTGDAARALGVDPATLWRWAKAGTVRPALRTPGRRYRWDLDDLRRQLAALDRGEQPPHS